MSLKHTLKMNNNHLIWKVLFCFIPVPSEFADVTHCNDDSTDKSALGEVWQL